MRRFRSLAAFFLRRTKTVHLSQYFPRLERGTNIAPHSAQRRITVSTIFAGRQTDRQAFMDLILYKRELSKSRVDCTPATGRQPCSSQ